MSKISKTGGETIFIDIHSHQHNRVNGPVFIRNAYHFLSPVQVEKLGYPVSVGIHPWHIEKFKQRKNNFDLAEYASLSNVWAFGEMGLDRAIPTSIAIQKEILEIQLNAIESLKKPVIIHCVRALTDLHPYFVKYKNISFILHDYRGNEIQTKELLKLENVFFSFGKSLFQPKQVGIFKDLPLDKIFLETDTSTIPIQKIYEKAADLKELPMPALQNRIIANFEAIF